MISKKAVEAFLNRQLDSFDWIKSCSEKELDRAIAELDPQPDFGDLKLFKHQKACFILIEELKRFLAFADMGLGKTLTTLLILKYRKQRGESPKAIIFVPYVTAVETWISETEKHTPELKCVPLNGTTDENRNSLLNDEGDLFVICYQSAVALLSEKTFDRKGKAKWNFTTKQVRRIFSGFDMIVCDEIHHCKNPNSLTYRMCRAISNNCDWAIGLTGTPFGRDLLDLWGQFYLIDFGETLGETLGMYRECLFSAKRNYWGGMEYKFKKKYEKLLHQMIKNRSIRYTVDECIDMPPKAYIKKWVKPTDTIKGYYDKAYEKLLKMVKSKGREAYEEGKSSFIQMRQLSSGFMTFKGEDTNKIEVEFDDNPKLDALMDLIDNMPHDSKMVVFHDFVYTNSMISKTLAKKKIKHARVWGGQKDPIGEIKKFRNDQECRVLVINTQSGSSSLNLQIANYVCFFEQPRSSTDRQQAEARCWRAGQDKKVFFYDLLVSNTKDYDMMIANQEGKDLLKSILDGNER